MFYYYGGKHSSADRYPKPRHRTIIEPFAGAASYAVYHLANGNADRAILIEKDPRVANLWRQLLTMTPAEVRAWPVPEAGDDTRDFFVMTTATSNGVAVSKRLKVTKRMPKLVRLQIQRVAAVLPHLLDRVEIIDGDYTDAPDVEATWFVDPPYQPHPEKATSSLTACPQGQGYAKGCRASDLDFAELATWCQARQGHVLVVEQEGADWLPFRPLFADTHDSQNRRKQEMVWSSHPDEIVEDPQLSIFDEGAS